MAATPILAEKKGDGKRSSTASFDPYVRLLKMLMPAMQGVIVHGGRGGLIWMSDGWQLAGVDAIVQEVLATAETDPPARIVGPVRGASTPTMRSTASPLRKDETMLQGVVTARPVPLNTLPQLPSASELCAAAGAARARMPQSGTCCCVTPWDRASATSRCERKTPRYSCSCRQRMPAADAQGDPMEQIYSTCTNHMNARSWRFGFRRSTFR